MSTTCPRCNGEVVWDWACHTYPRTYPSGQVVYFACMPCDSAIRFDCWEDDCQWHYTWGLNSNNPRAAKQEADRPDWLENTRYSFNSACLPKGIRYFWDDEDE